MGVAYSSSYTPGYNYIIIKEEYNQFVCGWIKEVRAIEAGKYVNRNWSNKFSI